MSMLRRIAYAVSSNPRMYQAIQNLVGQNRIVEQLRIHAPPSAGPFLDVGSSVGGVTGKLSLDATSIDIDLVAVQRAAGARRVVGDAARLPFADDSFETVLMVAVSHHLESELLTAAFAEIARVCRGRFLFVDAVRDDARLVSRALWHYDRGANPRTADDLLARLSSNFVIHDSSRFGRLHHYLMVSAGKRELKT